MKKRGRKLLVTVGIGMMLLTSSTVYAAGDDLLAFVNDISDDGSMIYDFEEVEIMLPADWRGKVRIKVEDNGVSFYHNESREKWLETSGTEGGKLFTLSYSVNDDFTEFPDYSYIGFSDESVMNYFLIFPTDVQGYMQDGAVAEEFQQLYSGIDYVKEHARMITE